MKFCAISDLHLRDSTPRCRKDDFIRTEDSKLRYIFDTTKRNGGKLLIAGDVFDSPREPYFIPSMLANFQAIYGVDVFAIKGQHDMFFHNSDTGNTPFDLLEQVGFLKTKHKNICFSSWEENNLHPADILLIHQMVVKDKPLFQDQNDYVTGASLIDQTLPLGYKIIITGDNHSTFITKRKGVLLINCGSITRTNIKQKDHMPCMFIIDTEDHMNYEQIFLPLDKDVFREEKIKREQDQSILLEIEKLTDKIKNNTKGDNLDFKTVIDFQIEKIKDKDLKKEIKSQIGEYFKEGK